MDTVIPSALCNAMVSPREQCRHQKHKNVLHGLLNLLHRNPHETEGTTKGHAERKVSTRALRKGFQPRKLPPAQRILKVSTE